MKTFESWIFSLLNEDVNATRYSVEITYRSKKEEVLNAFAKIALGYISAAIKNYEYHVKQVFDEKPYRILISQKNFWIRKFLKQNLHMLNIMIRIRINYMMVSKFLEVQEESSDLG